MGKVLQALLDIEHLSTLYVQEVWVPVDVGGGDDELRVFGTTEEFERQGYVVLEIFLLIIAHIEFRYKFIQKHLIFADQRKFGVFVSNHAAVSHLGPLEKYGLIPAIKEEIFEIVMVMVNLLQTNKVAVELQKIFFDDNDPILPKVFVVE